ncbi:hypothetical protein QUB56_04080 [Microcoleus sp. AR_TQ3_B6]|uniref:hypothetical protein n=1 Tax=Microcoleus sp. AR_TQ3_B6 TaxID=3055284 RepID=UPI002FD19F6F
MFFRRKTRFLGSWAINKTIAFIAEGRRKFGNGAWRGLNGCNIISGYTVRDVDC